MGTLLYGNATDGLEVSDRLLSHLMIVASTKLRRGESFTVTFTGISETGSGRTSIWLQPAIPLRFVYDDSEPCVVDRELLRSLADDASSSRGIVIDSASDLESVARRFDHVRAA